MKLACAVLTLVIGCSSESTGSNPVPQSDAGLHDSAPDSFMDAWNAGEGKSYEECMAEICANDLNDVCCCNPTSIQLTATGTCSYDYPSDIPTQWGPFTPSPDMVTISVLDESGKQKTAIEVTDEGECSKYDGFYFDYDDGGLIPNKIVLCPDICAVATAAGTITFQSGCYAIACC